MKDQKVIHVELKEPFKGKRHYYFGSKAAIYEDLSEDLIGIKKESLWNVDLDKVEYQNKFCTIRMGSLKRKQTDRGYKTKTDSINFYQNPINIMPGDEILRNVDLPTINMKKAISEEKAKELKEIIEKANECTPEDSRLIQDMFQTSVEEYISNTIIYGNNK